MMLCNLTVLALLVALALSQATRANASDSLKPKPEKSPDRAALMAVGGALGYKNWHRNKGWGTDDSICKWEGITCTANRVTGIDLGENGLDGYIHPAIGACWLRRLQRMLVHPHPHNPRALTNISSLT